METVPAPTLVVRLRCTAQLWVAAQQSSPSRLALNVVNDRGFFTRLETQVQGVTTSTLEKFAVYLADPANWPDGAVPQEAIDLAHVVGVSGANATLSPGIADGISRPVTAQGEAA